jgi:thiamine-monophosphate kinase
MLNRKNQSKKGMDIPMDEFALIRHLTDQAQNQSNNKAIRSYSQVVTGIGDDAAVVKLSEGMQLVAACDAMVDQVHFLPETMDDFHVGYKALVSNVSDMAAMGAIPKFALITLVTPKGFNLSRLESIYKGIYACAQEYNVAIIGGDTVSTPDLLTISVTILGEVEMGQALLRSTAQVGDVVFVTGPVGGSAAGLHYLLEKDKDHSLLDSTYIEFIRSHQMPNAQVDAGRLLLTSGYGHALNDISDGLASEAWEIAEASGKCIQLFAKDIPILDSVLQYASKINRSALEWALYGGEDYQLIGTLAAENWDSLRSQCEQKGLPIYPIGEVIPGDPEVKLAAENGKIERLEKKGFNHFGR